MLSLIALTACTGPTGPIPSRLAAGQGLVEVRSTGYKDGGANWNASAEFKEFYPQRFATDASGRNLMAVTTRSGVYLSSDEGKTWRLAQ